MIHDVLRIDPAYCERLRVADLDTVPKLLGHIDGRVAAWSRTTDTLFIAGVHSQPGWYLKRHLFPTWRKRLRGTFRGTFFGRNRADAEFQLLNSMRALGLPAVRPVACGVRRVAHFVAACFLLTEEVPDAQNLTTFAQDVQEHRRTLTRSARHLLLERLANQLADMHAKGFFHGNLFWRNVLVRFAPDDQPEFFFLDVQAAPWRARLGQHPQPWLTELAQTGVSSLSFTTRADRVRFVQHYLRRTQLTPTDREAIHTIDQLIQPLVRHEQRRIRMNHTFDQWNRQLAAEQRRGDLPGHVGANA